MERVQAVADGGAVPRARRMPWWCWLGYFFVASPVMSACAGVLDGPWSSGFAYAVMLLGVGFISRAVLPSRARPMERVQAEDEEDMTAADADAVSPDKVMMAWCGYFLVSAPMTAICAGFLDGPWAAGFAYAALLLGVGFISRAVLPSRARQMERVQAEEEEDMTAADADADADSHHDVAASSPNKVVMAWCGYFLVSAPMTATCADLLDGPWAAGFAYAALLLGVAFIYRAVFSPLPLPLPPRRQMERVQQQAYERRDASNHHLPSAASAMAWCGYLLVAAPVMGACAGLADTPGAALLGYALLLLGFAFIGLAMLPLRPMERMLEDEKHPVRNGTSAAVSGAAGTMAMDWTGYIFVAAPVVASWSGLVEGPAAAFFALALLLLGVAFLVIAMLAVAKPKMA